MAKQPSAYTERLPSHQAALKDSQSETEEVNNYELEALLLFLLILVVPANSLSSWQQEHLSSAGHTARPTTKPATARTLQRQQQQQQQQQQQRQLYEYATRGGTQ